jgi:hypothetical protein
MTAIGAGSITLPSIRPNRDGVSAANSWEEAGLWLLSRGAPKLELMVREGNDRAAKFYEALGFERQPVTVYGKWLKPLPDVKAKQAS